MTIVTRSHGLVDEYADLEIGLHRRAAVTRTVELRFLLPRTDAETRLDFSGPLLVDIDPRELDAIDDDEEYGAGLFGHGVWAAFQTAVATAAAPALQPVVLRRAGGPARWVMRCGGTSQMWSAG